MMAHPTSCTTRRNVSTSGCDWYPGIDASLSRVPPVWPRPRPAIIGTKPPQAATAGARTRLTASPTPPVECLSRTGPGRSQASRVPERVMARVSATRSSTESPRKNTAMAKAAAWPSLTRPEVRPSTKESISSAPSLAPSRLARIISCGSQIVTSRPSGRPRPRSESSVALPPAQSVGSERERQQVFEREAPSYALRAGDMDRGLGRGELADALAARAARRHQRRAVADDEDLGDAALAGGDHGGDGRFLGAGAGGISGVLDVAAGIHAAASAAHGRTDLEPRVGRVRAGLRLLGGCEEVVEGHRSGRKVQVAGIVEGDAGIEGELPHVTVRIRHVGDIAAPVGLVRRSRRRRAGRERLGVGLVHLPPGAQVLRDGDAREP